MKTIFFGHDQQDSPDARKNFMELAGYRVRTFSNSAALLAAFKDEMPDVLVMDVLLEGKNGFEVAAELNQNILQRHFPIVLCTRLYRAGAFREHAQRCGVSAYVLLPLSLEDFLRHINEAVRDYEPALDPPGAAAA